MKKNKLLKNILIYIGFIAVVAGNVLAQTVSSLDEVWIYNFGKCIIDRAFTI